MPAMNYPLEDLSSIFTYLKEDFEKLRGKKILITGGSGFIGSWLVESLIYAYYKLDLDCFVYLLVRDRVTYKDYPFIKLIGIHSLNFEYDYVIHCAHDPRIISVNMNLATYLGGITQNNLLLSSGIVCYGQNHSANPETRKYIASKLIAEEIYRYHKNKIVRIYSIFGPGQPLNSNYAIAKFIREGIYESKILLDSNSHHYSRSYLYIADLIIYLWKVLFYGDPSTVYELGGNEMQPIDNVAFKVGMICKKHVQLVPNVDLSGYLAPSKYGPTYSLPRFLDKIDCLSFDIALEKTIRWYETNKGATST